MSKSVICPTCADYVGGPLVRDCKTCGGMGYIREEESDEQPT